MKVFEENAEQMKFFRSLSYHRIDFYDSILWAIPVFVIGIFRICSLPTFPEMNAKWNEVQNSAYENSIHTLDMNIFWWYLKKVQLYHQPIRIPEILLIAILFYQPTRTCCPESKSCILHLLHRAYFSPVRHEFINVDLRPYSHIAVNSDIICTITLRSR